MTETIYIMDKKMSDFDGGGLNLGNGDSLSERLEALDLDETDTCSTEELRERLGL